MREGRQVRLAKARAQQDVLVAPIVGVQSLEQVVQMKSCRHYRPLKKERVDADPHTRILASGAGANWEIAEAAPHAHLRATPILCSLTKLVCAPGRNGSAPTTTARSPGTSAWRASSAPSISRIIPSLSVENCSRIGVTPHQSASRRYTCGSEVNT